MSLHKYISTIIHPIVIPTIVAMLYFLLIPNTFLKEQKFTVLSFIFILTYLIPLFSLIFLKRLKMIKSYKIESLKGRKLTVFLMIFLFYFLANSLDNILLEDLSLLFYATSVALFVIYILLFFGFKTSMHLVSLGISTGFFLILTKTYNQSFLIIIMIFFLLSGLLATSRLKLEAHTIKEVYTGFFIGILTIYMTSFIL